MVFNGDAFLRIKLYFHRQWRKRNAHNLTQPYCVFDPDSVEVGRATYGLIDLQNGTDHRLIIGNYCSIAGDVLFMIGREHNTRRISTYPFRVQVLGERTEDESKGGYRRRR